jgi:putative transcriptional regulator
MNTISQIRAHLGVTQTEMGDAIGVTQGNVSNYERGQAMPPHVAGRLIAFAATRGVTLTYDEIYASEYPLRLAAPAPARRATDPKPDLDAEPPSS